MELNTTGAVVIPAGVTLVVANGTTLSVESPAALTVAGTLTVANGGAIEVAGTLEQRPFPLVRRARRQDYS